MSWSQSVLSFEPSSVSSSVMQFDLFSFVSFSSFSGLSSALAFLLSSFCTSSSSER